MADEVVNELEGRIAQYDAVKKRHAGDTSDYGTKASAPGHVVCSVCVRVCSYCEKERERKRESVCVCVCRCFLHYVLVLCLVPIV